MLRRNSSEPAAADSGDRYGAGPATAPVDCYSAVISYCAVGRCSNRPDGRCRRNGSRETAGQGLMIGCDY